MQSYGGFNSSDYPSFFFNFYFKKDCLFKYIHIDLSNLFKIFNGFKIAGFSFLFCFLFRFNLDFYSILPVNF